MSKRGEKNMNKGQMWSVDVIIGIVIFVSVITLFYTTLSESGSDVRQNLAANADTVVTKFTQDPNLKVVNDNTLNTSKLEKLSKMNYSELKRELNVQGEFCIYLQGEDGRLIPIGNKSGIGKNKGTTINISNGVKCGADVS